MRRHLLTAAALVGLAASTALAQSPPPPQTTAYETVGSWDVRVDHTLGSCFMQAAFDNRKLFRTGLYRATEAMPDSGYVMLMGEHWTAQAGQSLPVQISLDNGAPHIINGSTIKIDNTVWLLVKFTKAAHFQNDLAVAQSVHIAIQGGDRVLDGALPSPALGVISVLRCNAAENGTAHSAPTPMPALPRVQHLPADPLHDGVA